MRFPAGVRRLEERLGDLAERFSGLPLRWQIGTLVLVGLVGIFALFGSLGYAIAEDGKQRTINQWLSITASTAGYIDSELEHQYTRLERLATLVGQESDPTRQRQILDDAFGQQEALVGGAFRLDRNGAIAWSQTSAALASLDYANARPRALDPATDGSRYASGIQTYRGQAYALLTVPIRGPDGRAVGVLGIALLPDRGVIGELVSSARGLAHTGHAELVDQQDLVIAASELGHTSHQGEHPAFYEPLLASQKSGVGLTAPVGPDDPADIGQRHDMAFVPLRTVPWGLALGGSDAELSADASRWQQQIVLFGGLSIALALLLVWLTTRGVVRPILALAAATRQIAAGDLTTPIPLGGEGEVRVLAGAFDQMRRELRGALSALALEESRYEGIVTSMADAVVTTDPELRITAFNPSAAALMGWKVEDALGRTSCDVLCARHASPDVCGGACPLASSEPGQVVSKETLRRRDGSEVPVAISRAPIHDESGRFAGTVHVLRDITAEAEVDRLKDEFLSTVSHELRTPLGFIMGYATTLLLPDAPDDKVAMRRCAEVIADASHELKELVDNLLDMAKIGAGSLSVSPGPMRLRPLVLSAVERIRVRGRGHRFVTALPSRLPQVDADSHRVEQVLYNLLDNAIKYSPDGGKVVVEASASGRDVIVSVIDEGMGIPTDELPTLFERFRRGRSARARGIAGTGLGLAICKGIVEAHGGRIWAESPPAEPRGGRPAAGTAIRFTVPVSSVGAAI